MISFIFGGSASGKSEYAETLACKFTGKKIYLATMTATDNESKQRIRKHQAMRKDKNFHTIEMARNLSNFTWDTHVDVILLECLGTLVANELFQEEGIFPNVCQKILNDLTFLSTCCNHLIVVSVDIFQDGILYDEGTRNYMQQLGEIHQNFCKISEHVVEVVYSIPVPLCSTNNA